MNYIVDRLEEDQALCEDEMKRMISIPRAQLPGELREGDVIRESNGTFSLDRTASEERRIAMKKKLMDLFE